MPQQAKFYALRNFLDPIPDTVGNGTATVSNPYPGKPRFHAFWESRFDYIPDQCHGGSTIHGLENMIVQSHGNKIYLFPAWPEEWDVNFKVHAAQNTVLEGVYQNGVLQSLTVTPSSRAADVINMSSAANRVRSIVGTCVADTNYLLGLPQMRDGLPALPAATASAVTGSWFSQYGTTLDGGLAGPFIAADWGGSMAKGNAIYLHVLEWPGETLDLAAARARPPDHRKRRAHRRHRHRHPVRRWHHASRCLPPTTIRSTPSSASISMAARKRSRGTSRMSAPPPPA